MNKKLHSEAVDQLFEAILCLKNKEECYTFFEDVCTINELLSLSQRFEVAKMLREKRTYLEISEKTGASTATISRVNRSLSYGNDGYEMVFERMEKKMCKIKKDGAIPTQPSFLITRLFLIFLFRIRRRREGCQFIHHVLDHLFFQIDIETQQTDKRKELEKFPVLLR